MRLNCGLDEYDKYQKIVRKEREWKERITNWHKHFAWLPVRIASNHCRWLETVERKGYLGITGRIYKYEYRVLEDQ